MDEDEALGFQIQEEVAFSIIAGVPENTLLGRSRSSIQLYARGLQLLIKTHKDKPLLEGDTITAYLEECAASSQAEVSVLPPHIYLGVFSNEALPFKSKMERVKTRVEQELKRTQKNLLPLVLVPVNYNNHWTLLSVYLDQGIAVYYDPYGPEAVNNDVQHAATDLLAAALKEMGVLSRHLNILPRIEKGGPRQPSDNRIDCGVYCAGQGEAIIEGRTCKLTDSSVGRYRRGMALCLLNENMLAVAESLIDTASDNNSRKSGSAQQMSYSNHTQVVEIFPNSS